MSGRRRSHRGEVCRGGRGGTTITVKKAHRAAGDGAAPWRAVVRHALRWLVWVLVLWAFWFLLVGEWNRIELVAAVCVSVVAATLAEAAITSAGLRARVPLEWVRRAKSVPVAVVVDFGIVMWLLVRSFLRRERVHGSFRVKPLEATEAGAAGLGARAWLVLSAGYSPNAFVVDVDEEHGVVLLHDLVPSSFSEEPA